MSCNMCPVACYYLSEWYIRPEMQIGLFPSENNLLRKLFLLFLFFCDLLGWT